MATIGFMNENEGRDFPFRHPAGTLTRVSDDEPMTLPLPTIVDFGAVLGPAAGFESGTHEVYLSRICRVGDRFYFDFTCQAPGCWGRVLRFSRLLADEEFLTEENDDEAAAYLPCGSESSEEPATPESSDDCTHEPIWSGYLVTGQLTDLAAAMADGEAWEGDETGCLIEPGLLQNLGGQFARSLNLANDVRTRASAPDGCAELEYQEGQAFVQRRCLAGPVRLQAGYNCVILQDEFENRLTLLAEAGSGLGPACDDVPGYPSEEAPAGRTALDGGLSCAEVIRSVAGSGGPRLELIAGRGATIVELPDENTVSIDIDMSRLQICFSESSENLVSEG